MAAVSPKELRQLVSRLEAEAASRPWLYSGRVGIEPCFEGKDLVVHEAVDLLAQEQKLVGKLEPGKEVHCGEVKTTGGELCKA